jgi:hypothetical protein
MKNFNEFLAANLQEQTWTVTDHLGHHHEVTAKDSSEAKKKAVSVGGVHAQGIPMSQWGKVKVSLKEETQLTEKNWIAGAIKHPGALHAKLGVPQGEKIPAKKINAAAKKPGVLGKEARLAKTLKSFHKEEVQSLTEISQGLALRVGKKRLKQAKSFTDAQSHAAPHDKRYARVLGDRAETLYGKSKKAYEYAFKKGMAKGEKLAKEEVELDELNKSTLKSYIKKSSKDLYRQAGARQVNYASSTSTKSARGKEYYQNEYKKANRKSINREKGIDRAVDKLHEAEQLDETMTRKHFQQVADVIKAHPDAEKRAELAKHHAGIFKASNPRFDSNRFYSAANATVSEALIKPSSHWRYGKPGRRKWNFPTGKKSSSTTKGIPGLEHLDLGDEADKSFEKQERARGKKLHEDAATPKFQVGQEVTPKIGPHTGIKHTVIHVHPDGSYNIKPKVHHTMNRYRQGAARAQEKDLE